MAQRWRANKASWREDRRKKPPRWRRILRAAWRIGITVLIVFIAVLSIMMVVYARDLPSPDRINNRDVALSTEIRARDGSTLYRIHGDEDRTFSALSDIPEYLREATIAVEDANFYHHIGFSVKGTSRAVIANLTNSKSQGGSTITQQFIKNAVLSPEKTYDRKLKELVLSLELELRYTKDEILQMYFNEIPYGSTAYGAAAAARTFFGKDLEDLSLAECAYLAGLPQRPTAYSPFTNPENGKARQEHVLNRMVSEKYITEEEATLAKNEVVTFKTRLTNITAPHFVFFVQNYLEEQLGLETRQIEQGGLVVTTSLDPALQTIAEEEVATGATYAAKFDSDNLALAAMDPQSGEILAMVGSKDFFGERTDAFDPQVNVITSYRQPGSSIKPIVYTEAFAKGFIPDSKVFDIETNFGNNGGAGPDYIPKNFSGSFAGPIDLRHALQQSLNIPAIKIGYLAGLEDISTLENELGYSNYEIGKNYGLAASIGAREVRAYDHLAAFSVLANEGSKVGPNPVLEVRDSNGNVLYQADYTETRVIDENISRITTNVLSDNGARAWGQNVLAIQGRPVAAKTGTSNKKNSNGSIAPNNLWTIGYTPSLAAVVWSGNNDDTTTSLAADGVNIAAPVWHNFMTRALEGTPVEKFTDPQIPARDKPMMNGDLGEEQEITICQPSNLLATANCPEDHKETRKVKVVHEMLHYVNRNDPLGPVPTDPASDPLYQAWEEALKKWITDNNHTEYLTELPTETDNQHEPDQWPLLSIGLPDGSTLTTMSFNPQLSITATAHPITFVELFIDDALRDRTEQAPYFPIVTLPSDITSGYHAFAFVVHDDVGNSVTAKIQLNISPPASPTINLISPISGSTYATTLFPLTLQASVGGTSTNVQRVEFYYQTSGGTATLLGSTPTPSAGAIYSYSWSVAPAAGTYTLWAKVITNLGAAQSAVVDLIVKNGP